MPGKREDLRKSLTKRDGRSCHWCGIAIAEADVTIDHLVPHVLGGKDGKYNLVLACVACNGVRGHLDAVFAEWVQNRKAMLAGTRA